MTHQVISVRRDADDLSQGSVVHTLKRGFPNADKAVVFGTSVRDTMALFGGTRAYGVFEDQHGDLVGRRVKLT